MNTEKATGELIIRQAKLKDLTSIMRILNDDILYGGNTLDTIPWNRHQGLSWFFRHDPETYPIFVAVLDGNVVGYSALNPYRNAFGFERICENSIYIDEHYRRHGIATKLVSTVLEEAKKLGYRIVMATVVSHNIPSRRLHESLGYEVMTELVNGGQRGGRPIDLLLLKRVL